MPEQIIHTEDFAAYQRDKTTTIITSERIIQFDPSGTVLVYESDSEHYEYVAAYEKESSKPIEKDLAIRDYRTTVKAHQQIIQAFLNH